MKKLLMGCLLLLLAQPVLAADFKPLTLNSLPVMMDTHAGKRHAVLFWSLTCIPCRGELTELSRLEQVDQLPLVLVNTGDEPVGQATAFLQDIGLNGQDHWRFADSIPARLRNAIDDNWYGELPFSVAVDAGGERFSHSGLTDIPVLVNWLGEQP